MVTEPRNARASMTETAIAKEPGSVPTEISVVIPVFREEGSIRPLLSRLEPTLEKLGTYEIIFCYDPSPDRTREVILEEILRNPNIRLLTFSRRFGQPSAVIAGLDHSVGRTCAVIDADLQDPPELIADLHAKLAEGYDVVLARRPKRLGETRIRKVVSYWGYRVLNALADVEIPPDTGEFRIMNRRVVDELIQLKERHGFLRGLSAFVGFRQGFVDFERAARAVGQTNYSRYLPSMRHSLDGVIGFSTGLLTATLFAGVVIAGFSFLIGAFVTVMKLFFDEHYPLGVPTLIVLAAFLGGVQLIAIGILGQYIGRIYDEVRQRPRYIVDRYFNPPDSTHTELDRKS